MSRSGTPSIVPPGPDRGVGRAAILLLSLAVLLLEVAYTRIFSFSLWYHFTYVALSVALLGYGASGAFLAASERLARQPPALLMSRCMVVAAGAVLVSLLTIVFLPLQPFSIASSPLQLVLMVLFFLLNSAPFFAAGMAMASAFRATRSPHGVYFADLLGAGAGCLIAVVTIWALGAPGAAVASALVFVIAGVLAAPGARRGRYAALGAAAVVACALFAAGAPFRPSAEKLLAKMMAAGAKPLYSRWSPIFRVDVYGEPLPGQSGRRGVSPRFTGAIPTTRFIAHDGTAEAPMFEFHGDLRELAFLERNVSAAPYVIATRPHVLVIGLGGGFDVLNGLRNGAAEITGVELDPVTVDVVRHHQADFNGGILARADVRAVVAEGRSFLQHSGGRYDVIQLTGVDTLAALSTGAYMLAESYLYTVEAFEEYLGHLSPDGTLSLMIGDLAWRGGRARFSLRHLANFIAAAEQTGIADPAAHAAIVATPGDVPMIELMFKRRPFTVDEVRALQAFAGENGFEVWHLPGVPTETPYTRMLTADAEGRAQLLGAYPLNIAATWDDRPFFFHFYRWRDLLCPAAWEVDTGHTLATGQLVLGAILIVAVITSIAFIVGPLLSTPALRRPGLAPFVLYFAAIGVGFMLIEISLIQHFILFLGHPTYSVAVILFALLVWTGLGSHLSGRLAAPPRSIVRAAFVSLLVLLAFYVWFVPLFFAYWLGAPPGFRYAVTVVLLLPLGLTLGVFFPTGLREVRRRDELLVPWAWGANGAASVVGSILAIVLAISFGFRAVLLLSAAVYLLAAAALPTAPAAADAGEAAAERHRRAELPGVA